MGLLVDGVWRDQWYDTAATGGRFERKASAFRDWVTADGAPGPSGRGGFKAGAGRYHLYVSLACPWAHRTLIGRVLKGLEDAITVSVVDPHMGGDGWVFGDSPGATPDPIHGARRLYEVYLAADPSYTGRVTVPVLWDRERATIVSNESAEILRMLNGAFGGTGPDLYPQDLRAAIPLRGRGRGAVCRTRRPRGAPRPRALPLRRPPDRGRHPSVHDPGALRRGLCRSFQVQ